MARRQNAVGDIFHGDCAESYTARRAAGKAWSLENAALERMISGLPTGLRVLDAPFGAGRFVDLYRARDMQITGLDISQAMLDAAVRECGARLDGCRLDAGSADALPYPDDSFDLVVSFRFLSGIVDSRTALASMREFARVSPRAILQLKCRPEALEPAEPPAPTAKLSKNYFRRDMDSLFASTGWRIETSEQIDSDPRGERWAFEVSRMQDAR